MATQNFYDGPSCRGAADSTYNYPANGDCLKYSMGILLRDSDSGIDIIMIQWSMIVLPIVIVDYDTGNVSYVIQIRVCQSRVVFVFELRW
jgi:hypothetical protein